MAKHFEIKIRVAFDEITCSNDLKSQLQANVQEEDKNKKETDD